MHVFDAGKKGLGLRLLEGIAKDDFIIEYTGEVISEAQFQKRKKEYSKSGVQHFYFMGLQNNEVILDFLSKSM